MKRNAALVLAARFHWPGAANGAGGARSGFRVCPALLMVLLLAAWNLPAALGAGSFRLAALSVVGSKRYKGPAIVPVTGLKLGESLTPGALHTAADRLAASGVFSQVTYRYETRGDALTAVFTVQDAKKLLPCTFANFVWLSQPQLMEQLRSHVPLFEGSVPVAGDMVDLVSKELESMLEAHGIHAQVNFNVQTHLGGPATGIEFREVGVPTPVEKIEFAGVNKINPTLLQKAARPLLAGNYDAPFFRSFSTGTLLAVYRRRGYLRAKIGQPVPHLIAGAAVPNAVEVTFPVSEGERYDLANVTWSGASVIPYKKLAKFLHAKVGHPVNGVQFKLDVLGMLHLFHLKGYLMAETSSKATLNNAAHSAVYHIEIRQGDLFHMGKLRITGLDAKHAELVKRLCRMRAGDPYQASYWSGFLHRVFRRLPASRSGWKFGLEPTVHPALKTVDVQLTFSHAAGN